MNDTVRFDRTDLAIASELRTHVTRFDDLPPSVQRQLIDNSKRTLPEPDNAVDREFARLAALQGFDISPTHGVWNAAEVELRDRLYNEASATIAALVAPPAPDDIIVGDPAELRRDARQKYAAAVAVRDKAQAAHARATTRLAEVESGLSAFGDLDDQVAEHQAEMFRNDTADEDLPYHLSSALRDRSKLLDRADAARAAALRLQADLRQADAAVAPALKKLREVSAMCLYASAEPLAAELQAARQSWLAVAEKLAALAYTCPDTSTPLPPAIATALNAPPPAPERKENLVAEWQAAHRRLMADGDQGDFD